VRGDQVFGERFCATTDGITSTDDSFPDEDFFPDISALYIDDMANDAGANVNANANLNANANPPAAPYAICSYLFQFLLQFLVLAFRVDVICSSILLVCMVRLLPTVITMLYYWLFWIKSYGKLLIFSTIIAAIRLLRARNRLSFLLPAIAMPAHRGIGVAPCRHRHASPPSGRSSRPRHPRLSDFQP
jgi:hypothetical protein